MLLANEQIDKSDLYLARLSAAISCASSACFLSISALRFPVLIIRWLCASASLIHIVIFVGNLYPRIFASSPWAISSSFTLPCSSAARCIWIFFWDIAQKGLQNAQKTPLGKLVFFLKKTCSSWSLLSAACWLLPTCNSAVICIIDIIIKYSHEWPLLQDIHINCHLWIPPPLLRELGLQLTQAIDQSFHFHL